MMILIEFHFASGIIFEFTIGIAMFCLFLWPLQRCVACFALCFSC
jgi:hypothetical protein